jgi:hypothetical protein
MISIMLQRCVQIVFFSPSSPRIEDRLLRQAPETGFRDRVETITASEPVLTCRGDATFFETSVTMRRTATFDFPHLFE